eukprot:7072208-Pyramimonas_sp.AAC.1
MRGASAHGRKSPALAMVAASPKVLSAAVFPPVLGPVIATTFVPAGTCAPPGTQSRHWSPLQVYALCDHAIGHRSRYMLCAITPLVTAPGICSVRSRHWSPTVPGICSVRIGKWERVGN